MRSNSAFVWLLIIMVASYMAGTAMGIIDAIHEKHEDSWRTPKLDSLDTHFNMLITDYHIEIDSASAAFKAKDRETFNRHYYRAKTLFFYIKYTDSLMHVECNHILANDEIRR